MATIGVNVAVLHDGKVLLTKREDYHVWCLPGGHIDPGETFPQTAIREVREETGLEVRLDRLVGIYSRPHWGDYHIVVFAARAVGGAMRGQPGEVIAMGYFAPDALPEALLLGQRQRILDAAAGKRGICRREPYPLPFEGALPREEMYRRRDASGLAREEFYRRYVGVLEKDSSEEEV